MYLTILKTLKGVENLHHVLQCHELSHLHHVDHERMSPSFGEART